MFLTIFTPTYNRAKLLKQCFKSLQQQSIKNFEWIIVDDGSTDNTENVVHEFKKESEFEIEYFQQKNAGKHIAINKGVSLAKGNYFFILDSDDFLPLNALVVVLNRIEQNKNKTGFIGVAGRRSDLNNRIIGSEFIKDIYCSSIDIRYKHKIKGDLAEVFKTTVLKQFPFPQYKNEKFCPEALIWNRIAIKHQLLFFNEPIYTCDYLDNGLTDNIVKVRMQSPKASMLYYSELSQYPIPVIQKLKAVINYWRFSFCAKQSFQEKMNQISSLYSLIGLPLGYLFHLKDKLKLR